MWRLVRRPHLPVLSDPVRSQASPVVDASRRGRFDGYHSAGGRCPRQGGEDRAPPIDPDSAGSSSRRRRVIGRGDSSVASMLRAYCSSAQVRQLAWRAEMEE